MGIIINLFGVLLQLFSLFNAVNSCDTPEEWLSGDSRVQKGIGFLIPLNKIDDYQSSSQVWPQGIVKYKLHNSLTLKDRMEVQKAIDEYHQKTCVRFKPWVVGDRDFVSIEVNNNVCGKVHVCKIGGYQFATFGKHCRNMSTMIHQLGHTLCLGHKNPNQQAGSFVESVQGMDAVNLLYKCHGQCHRHRWVLAVSLTYDDMANMHNFGYELNNGSPIYPCRAAIDDGIISAGIYNDSRKTCSIADRNKVYEVLNGVEVLTIPGGLREDCNVYTLVDTANILLHNGIQVGTTFRNNSRLTSHIAFGTIAGEDGVTQNSVGNVWMDGRSEAKRSGSVVYKISDYRILSCIQDTACMIEKWYADKKNCKRTST